MNIIECKWVSGLQTEAEQNKRIFLELIKGSFRTNKNKITQEVLSKRNVQLSPRIRWHLLKKNQTSHKIKESKLIVHDFSHIQPWYHHVLDARETNINRTQSLASRPHGPWGGEMCKDRYRNGEEHEEVVRGKEESQKTF